MAIKKKWILNMTAGVDRIHRVRVETTGKLSEQVNEPLGSIKCRKYTDQMRVFL